jgi:hypothetical protein
MEMNVTVAVLAVGYAGLCMHCWLVGRGPYVV